MALIDDPADIAAVADALSRAPLVAFDLEFASADRLVPLLCLVQVAWLDEHISLDAPAAEIVAAEPQVRLIDPLAGDVAPIVRALAAHPLVLAHAPRQDIQLLATRHGLAALPGAVDTQIMAAFAGHGDQVGFATLANELVHTNLGKDQQWTAWERRPLSEAQLAYAIADVRYLPAIYALLAGRLGPRLAWAREETQGVVADALAAAAVTAETAWENIGGARGLDPAAHAALVALAAWRYETAVELDRPLGQVVNDKQLLELARHRPKDAGGVRATKGMSPIAKTRADAIVAVLACTRGAASGGARRPPSAPSPRAQRWSEALLAIAHVLADDAQLASRLLATRSDAEEFARAFDDGGAAAAEKLPALATWRREVLGAKWLAWLDGSLALVGDTSSPHGMRLVAR